MAKEENGWIMHGISEDTPGYIHNSSELIEYVDKVGFLPLFKNSVKGFSVEEHTSPDFWWTGDEERDPWEWRIQVTKSHRAAYGKFFGGKCGYISLKWLPVFANYRRNGYDFDSLWEDELAQYRQKKIMECFDIKDEIISYELKEISGFGKGGEKNFEGILTSLQQEIYLVPFDFRRKLNKRGEEYGWNIAVYSKPEHIWEYENVTSSYKEEPSESYEKILSKVRKEFPDITEKDIFSLIGKPIA